MKHKYVYSSNYFIGSIWFLLIHSWWTFKRRTLRASLQYLLVSDHWSHCQCQFSINVSLALLCTEYPLLTQVVSIRQKWNVEWWEWVVVEQRIGYGRQQPSRDNLSTSVHAILQAQGSSLSISKSLQRISTFQVTPDKLLTWLNNPRKSWQVGLLSARGMIRPHVWFLDIHPSTCGFPTRKW